MKTLVPAGEDGVFFVETFHGMVTTVWGMFENLSEQGVRATMSPQWNRILIGILAVVCVLSGLAVGIFHSWGDLWCGSFIRAGVLLTAIFIGMPTKGRAAAWANVSPAWILAGAAGLVLLGRVIHRPQVLIPIFSVLFVLMWVWPWLAGLGRRSR